MFDEDLITRQKKYEETCRQFAGILQELCIGLGFNKFEGKERFYFRMSDEGTVASLQVWDIEKRRIKSGWLFKSIVKLDMEKCCGSIKFTLKDDLSNFDSLYCEDSIVENDLLPETIKKWIFIKEEIENMSKVLEIDKNQQSSKRTLRM